MKDWMKKIFVAALCIMLVVSLVRIHNLKEELERETGYMRSQIQSMESQISSIYRNVDQMLEKEASLLTFQNWEIASMDVENETATVAITIIPKEYQAGMTEAVLQIGDREYAMKMDDGSYQAEVEIPLFETCMIDAVVLRDSTYTRTEYLEWAISPRDSMLMDVYTNMNGGWSFGSYGKDYNTLKAGDAIEISIESKGESSEIRSVNLLEILDGKVQARTPVSADEHGRYSAPCKETYEVPFGTCFELAAEVVDQYGLVYRATVWRWKSDKDGQPVDDDMVWYGRGAAIYNQDGKLLYME